jgi:multiple sugar transport system ATP-binding protein
MASIKLDNVDKVFANGHVAARGINLEVADGEFVVLVGPSGCGKSTILRMVAGLETPTGGRVLLGDRDVTGLPPQERDLAMVFQSYALYPHKTVRDNLAFGLRMRRTPSGVIAQRVERVARALGIEGFLDRKPGQLSGGQRQRVALGRAIVREPQAFLFDEPLSNLDPQLRGQARTELARLHRQLGATMLYVTHDQEEAMTLGNRVAVLRDGCLQQLAPPLDVYRRPTNSFVGGFIGSPAMNFFRGTLGSEAGSVRLETPWFTLVLDAQPGLAAKGKEVLLGVRPHDLTLVDPGQADAVARVDVIQPLGSELLVPLHLSGPTGETPATTMLPPETKIRVDEQVGVRFRRDRLHLFDAGTGVRLN